MSINKFEKDLERMKKGKNWAGNINTCMNDLICDEELIHEWEEYLLQESYIFAYCSKFREVDSKCKKLSEKDFLMMCIIMMNNKIKKLDDQNYSFQEKLAEIMCKDE